MSDEWKVPLECEKKLTLESVEFCFHQAEKMLETLIAVTDSMQARAVKLLALYLPITIGLVGYISINFANYVHSLPLMIILAGIVYSSWGWIQILKPRKSYRVGSMPEKIVVKDWTTVDAKNQKRAILLNECREYNKRIKARCDANDEAGALLSTTFRDLAISTVLGFLVFIIALLCRNGQFN